MAQCAACGSPCPPDVQHCPECGAGTRDARAVRAWNEPAERDRIGARTGPLTRNRTRVAGAAVAAILALGAIGGFLAVRASGTDSAVNPPENPGSTSQPATGEPDTSRPSTPVADPTPAGGPAGTSSPPSSPTSSATSSTHITVAKALVDQPHMDQVAATLAAYFDAIEARDYEAYRTVLTNTEDRIISEEEFETGYRSTHNSDVRVTGASYDEEGGVLASVAFRSHQDARDSPDGRSTCLDWVVAFPMVPVGDQYMIDLVRLSFTTHRPC